MQAENPLVIVLAAGQATRFIASGGKVNKLQARLGERTVMEHVVSTVAAAGLECHIVRHAAGDGMGDSIAAGVAATAQAAGWLILPGDLPLVRADSLLAVASALRTQPVVVPFHQGQHGHPVGFARECGAALRKLGGDEGARRIVRAYRQHQQVLQLDLDDPGIVLDIDTLADLARAEAMLASRGGQNGKH